MPVSCASLLLQFQQVIFPPLAMVLSSSSSAWMPGAINPPLFTAAGGFSCISLISYRGYSGNCSANRRGVSGIRWKIEHISLWSFQSAATLSPPVILPVDWFSSLELCWQSLSTSPPCLMCWLIFCLVSVSFTKKFNCIQSFVDADYYSAASASIVSAGGPHGRNGMVDGSEQRMNIIKIADEFQVTYRETIHPQVFIPVIALQRCDVLKLGCSVSFRWQHSAWKL